jgi:serine/threonine protein kinase
MPISTGTRLGSYEITSAIGAGGMGEVYQAHDTKLGRDVAIKVLPEAFAHDPERLSRFQREAKMLAALNHPNIATIYGLELSNGTSYLVMELVSGETLADRIKREGEIPVEEALKIAIQIAEALEAAHEKGIIHRDLKPANVKVTTEGKVKVLDLGLAKAFAGDAASDDPSNSPTLSMAATMQGVILGTAAYMSPEQARGKAVDRRSDIWAFGCVLYELLTGKQAFRGETVTEILASILRGEPDWQALPLATSAQIRTLLKRCLQRDKALRLQAAGDVRIELQEALAAPAEEVTTTVRRDWNKRQVAIFIVLATALIALTGTATWVLKPAPVAPAPVTRSVFSLPAGDSLQGDLPSVALSPDGKYLVYAARRGTSQQLYLHSMDSFEARPIPDTEGGSSPFFSPDSQSIGFFADSQLKKVSINGGGSIAICPAPAGILASGTWGSDGNIIFQNVASGGLWEVPAAGGTSKTVNTLQKGELTNRWPVFVGGARAVAFVAADRTQFVTAQLVLYELGSHLRQTLGSGTGPSYVPTGHLLYVQGGTLTAQPFELERMKLAGAPVPIVEGVFQPSNGASQYSVSQNGTLAYVAGGLEFAQNLLVWVDRKGQEQTVPMPPHHYRSPRVSPDGKYIAVVLDDQGGQVWIYDISRNTLTRLTFESGGSSNVVWTPDGKRVIFNSGVPLNLYSQPADGSGKAERLTASDNVLVPSSVAPDGQAIAYFALDPKTSWDVWSLRLSDRQTQAFLRTPAYEGSAQFSPDGRWMAYVSD